MENSLENLVNPCFDILTWYWMEDSSTVFGFGWNCTVYFWRKAGVECLWWGYIAVIFIFSSFSCFNSNSLEKFSWKNSFKLRIYFFLIDFDLFCVDWFPNIYVIFLCTDFYIFLKFCDFFLSFKFFSKIILIKNHLERYFSKLPNFLKLFYLSTLLKNKNSLDWKKLIDFRFILKLSKNIQNVWK